MDARLGEIQVELLTSVSQGAQAEVLAIRRRLADAVQSLSWYAGDLDDLDAGGVGQLPGMGRGAQPHFDTHLRRVIRMRDAARDYREEAGDVLGQFSANISDRQGEVINFLAVISAIFLPLSFFTGYFGMNFAVISDDLNSVWIFILLGNLIPAACVVLGFVLFRRWVTRLGIPRLMPARRRPDKRRHGQRQQPPIRPRHLTVTCGEGARPTPRARDERVDAHLTSRWPGLALAAAGCSSKSARLRRGRGRPHQRRRPAAGRMKDPVGADGAGRSWPSGPAGGGA